MDTKALRNGAWFSLACGSVLALVTVSGTRLDGLLLLPVAVFLPGLVFLGWRHSVVSGNFGWGKAFWTGLVPAISSALTGLVLVFLGFITAMAQTQGRDGILAYGILATFLAFSPLAGGIGGLLRNLFLVLQGGGEELAGKEPAQAAPQSGEAAAVPPPSQELASGLEAGCYEQPYRLLLSLPFFAALGAAVVVNSVMFHRVILGDYDASFLLWLFLFLLSLAGCILALYSLQSLRERRGGLYLFGMNTLSMALCSVFAGMLGAYYLWTPPPLDGWAERMDKEIAARRAAAQSLVSVSGISESHVPGSGEIVLKIMVAAARPVKISGGGWVSDWAKYDGPKFSCEGEEQLVTPGPAREVILRIVYPDRDFIPPLAADGPYMIPEIAAYVRDLAAEGRHSEKVVLGRHYRTGAYKAGTFGRGKIRLAGDK